MKTQTFTQKKTFKVLGFFALFMVLALATNPLAAQTERTVKGIVSDESGPVESATVILKGTNIYVDTDEKGAFTFPQKLKENDKLVVSLIGFEKEEVNIGPNTSFIKILMDEYAITLIGALRMGDNSVPKKHEN